MILLLLFLLLVLLLCFPEITACGAKEGLFLWSSTLVPSLFPFSLLTSLLTQYCGNGKKKYLVLCTGLLSGFPLGVILSGTLLEQHQITKRQAIFFSLATNLPSPMFLIFFVCQTQLNCQRTFSFLILLYISSFLGGYLYSSWQCKDNHFIPLSSPHPPHIHSLDVHITKSIQLILKIGAYVVLFSIVVSFVNRVPLLPSFVKTILCLFLEITTGITNLCQTPLSHDTKIILSLGACSLGGLSCAAQTNAYLPKTGLTFSSYLIGKLLNCLIALLLSNLFLHFHFL